MNVVGYPINVNMKQKNKDNIDPKGKQPGEEFNEKRDNDHLEQGVDKEMDKMTGDEANLEENDKIDSSSQEETLEKELDALQKKHDELNDSYLRLHAEYDNFRKRTLKEKTELIKNGGERVLLDIVSLVDDFERALDSLNRTDDKEAMLEGIDLIYTKFISFLKQHGVKEIETIGQSFDADRFEAVTTIPVTDESQKGTVVDCIQKGYELNEKIIRFPKVIVGE